MRVIVFGGAGFLGRVLVKQLLTVGHQVDVITRSVLKTSERLGGGVNILEGDMVTGKYPHLHTYDVVINCAGEIRDESSMRSLHVDALRKALESLSPGCKTHWVQVSSVGVYGPKKYGLVLEDEEFNPIGEYEITKAEGDCLVRELLSSKSVDFTIIRPSNVFGNEMPSVYLAQLISMIRRHIFFYIGNPQLSMMNFVHVNDVASSIVSCINNPGSLNEDFIVSDLITLKDFTSVVQSEVGFGWIPSLPEPLVRALLPVGRFIPGFPLSVARVDALTTRVVYSSEKIRSRLGWMPELGVEKGIAEYCQYIRSED